MPGGFCDCSMNPPVTVTATNTTVRVDEASRNRWNARRKLAQRMFPGHTRGRAPRPDEHRYWLGAACPCGVWPPR